MSPHAPRPWLFQPARGTYALTLAFLATAACRGNSGASTPAPAPRAAAAVAVAVEGARVETPHYAVGLRADPKRAVVTITAKPPLHINADYPAAFRPDPGPVTFASAKVPLTSSSKVPCAAHAEETCEANSELAFASGDAAPGAAVSGTVFFSVCEPERCLIEKAHVAAAVQ